VAKNIEFTTPPKGIDASPPHFVEPGNSKAKLDELRRLMGARKGKRKKDEEEADA